MFCVNHNRVFPSILWNIMAAKYFRALSQNNFFLWKLFFLYTFRKCSSFIMLYTKYLIVCKNVFEKQSPSLLNFKCFVSSGIYVWFKPDCFLHSTEHLIFVWSLGLNMLTKNFRPSNLNLLDNSVLPEGKIRCVIFETLVFYVVPAGNWIPACLGTISLSNPRGSNLCPPPVLASLHWTNLLFCEIWWCLSQVRPWPPANEACPCCWIANLSSKN